MEQAEPLEATAEAETPAPLIPRGAWWVFVLAPPLLSFLLSPDVFGRSPRDIALGVLNTWIITVATGLPVYLAYVHVLPRAFRTVRAGWQRGLLQLAVIAGSVAFGVGLDIPVGPALCSLATEPTAASIGQAVYISSVITGVYVLTMLTYERLKVRVQREEARATQMQRRALEAQLGELRARTNPHFLFNSLNVAASLTHEDPKRAEEVIERLAALFRYTLEGSRQRRVPLARELEIVEDYLAVEAIRLGARLQWTLVAEDDVGEIQVPPLVLQPLVENAVRHGIGQLREGGTVRVRAFRDDGHLRLEVVDDGPGPEGSSHRGTGTSLADLEERLALELSGEAQLATGPARDDAARPGFRVTVTLPIEAP